MQHPGTQQREAGTAVHLPLDRLEPVDLAFHRAVAPRLLKRRRHRCLVLPDPLGPLDRIEHWLRKSPEDPDLLAASAKLALRAELIGKARSYLEASLARRPTPENALLYADLLEQLGEGDRARSVLRDSVARSLGRRPTLPRVRLRRR